MRVLHKWIKDNIKQPSKTNKTEVNNLSAMTKDIHFHVRRISVQNIFYTVKRAILSNAFYHVIPEK